MTQKCELQCVAKGLKDFILLLNQTIGYLDPHQSRASIMPQCLNARRGEK